MFFRNSEEEREEREAKEEEKKFKENIEELASKMTSVSVYDRADVSSEMPKPTTDTVSTATEQAPLDKGTESDSVTKESEGAVGGAGEGVGGAGGAVGGAGARAGGAVGGAGGAVGGATGAVSGAGTSTDENLQGAVGGTNSSLLEKLNVVQALEEMGHQQMFAVQPLTWCPHLETVQPLPGPVLDTEAPCLDCGNVGENWICLICYKVYCSRYVNEHMVIHGATEQHLVTLSFSDLSVWCYGCDNYIDNQVRDRLSFPRLFNPMLSGFQWDLLVSLTSDSVASHGVWSVVRLLEEFGNLV
ncbi:uncharacterized protein [Argopecten irradians]|uniref:uncharacterized protein n=1 Tax=Argopecten irradians TaxID=31199 RepID=UPI0037197F3F